MEAKIISINTPGKVYVKEKSTVLYDAWGKPIPRKNKRQRYVVHPEHRKAFAFAAKHQLKDLLNAMFDQGLVVIYEVNI